MQRSPYTYTRTNTPIVSHLLIIIWDAPRHFHDPRVCSWLRTTNRERREKCDKRRMRLFRNSARYRRCHVKTLWHASLKNSLHTFCSISYEKKKKKKDIPSLSILIFLDNITIITIKHLYHPFRNRTRFVSTERITSNYFPFLHILSLSYRV